MEKQGILIIVSGFSGAGKGTIIKELVNDNKYSLSVSATTREPRVGEIHGKHYYFIDKEKFEDMISNGEFVEWAKYCDNYYGTPKKYVNDKLKIGENVILEIEMQGALKVKEQFNDSVLIFIIPPSIKELKNRLVQRGTETIDIINKRLNRAFEEANLINNYDYIVINNNIAECVNDINSIIEVEQKKVSRYNNIKNKLKQQFKELLKGEI
jgi:guanylate kinase